MVKLPGMFSPGEAATSPGANSAPGLFRFRHNVIFSRWSRTVANRRGPERIV